MESKQPNKASGKKVCLHRLKRWTRKNLPVGSTLRELILSEKEEISPKEYLIKIETWLKLFDLETRA
jgi:hypothetical protein